MADQAHADAVRVGWQRKAELDPIVGEGVNLALVEG